MEDKMIRRTELLRRVSIAAITILAATPAFAGVPATPAPLLGAGLPAVAAFGAGYWALRRWRRPH